jgi:hypothetical protein
MLSTKNTTLIKNSQQPTPASVKPSKDLGVSLEVLKVINDAMWKAVESSFEKADKLTKISVWGVSGIHVATLNSAIHVAKELTAGKDIRTAVTGCIPEISQGIAKNVIETLTSNATLTTLGKVGSKALGSFVGEILFSDPLNPIDKENISQLKTNALHSVNKQLSSTASITSQLTAKLPQASAAKALVTKAPVAKTPISKAPVSKAPITKAPVTKAHVTKAPVAKAPIAKAPVIKTPVAKVPIAKAPVTKAPIAKAHVAKAPIAKAVMTKTSTPAVKQALANEQIQNAHYYRTLAKQQKQAAKLERRKFKEIPSIYTRYKALQKHPYDAVAYARLVKDRDQALQQRAREQRGSAVVTTEGGNPVMSSGGSVTSGGGYWGGGNAPASTELSGHDSYYSSRGW